MSCSICGKKGHNKNNRKFHPSEGESKQNGYQSDDSDSGYDSDRFEDLNSRDSKYDKKTSWEKGPIGEKGPLREKKGKKDDIDSCVKSYQSIWCSDDPSNPEKCDEKMKQKILKYCKERNVKY